MHLPDTYLSPAAGVAFCVGAAVLVGRSTTRLALTKDFDRRVPFIGALAALAFAMRLVRFPLAGTAACGHLGGALLMAVLIGPDAAFVALVAVQVVQAVVFADGGLLALGVNVVNGAAWPAWFGLPLFRLISPPGSRPARVIVAAVVASLVAGELAALGVAVAVGPGGPPAHSSLHFLLLVAWAHLPLSILEGLATGAALAFGRRLLGDGGEGAIERSGGTGVLVLLGIALFSAAVLADFASRRPEWPGWSVAEAQREPPPALPPLIADSTALQQRLAVLRDYGEEASPAGTWFGQAATSVSGLFGAIVSALLALVPALIVARMRHVVAEVRARRADRPAG